MHAESSSAYKTRLGTVHKEKPVLQIVVQVSFLLQAESLVETVNTSTGVNQLLLAGIERVALGANFNTDILLGRTGGKDVATGAADSGLLVVGMDAFLHVFHLFLISLKGHNDP